MSKETLDDELAAIKEIITIMERLRSESQKRVISYLIDRYKVIIKAIVMSEDSEKRKSPPEIFSHFTS